MKRLAHHFRDYLKGRCTPDEVYQVETIGRLIDGDFTGSTTYGEVMKHGDFGLGTFVDLDGEMAAVDGHFYHFGPDGRGTPVAPETQTPFAVVKHFQADVTFHLPGSCDLEALQQAIDARLPNDEAMCAVKVSARFPSPTSASCAARTIPRPWSRRAATSRSNPSPTSTASSWVFASRPIPLRSRCPVSTCT